MNPKVDEYINKAKKWQDEISKLRAILLDCQLTEELKWRVPCYTYKDKNLFIIGAFKEYIALSFLKGVLLSDTNKILVSPGENSQSVRFLKFTSLKEINKLEKTIKTYIFEAIEAEKAGLKIDFTESKNLVFPKELTNKLNSNSKFKKAFEALTPGRQRAYNIFFSSSKQSKTIEARIEKYTPRILNGKGMNDCVCGLSKRMPNCDGSHKFIERK